MEEGLAFCKYETTGQMNHRPTGWFELEGDLKII